MSTRNALDKLARAPAAVWRRVANRLLLASLGEAGRNVLVVSPKLWAPRRHIHLGNDVFFGPDSFISLGRSHLWIGEGVMFGPEAMILGGDHNYLTLGRRMWDCTTGGTEADIRIADDVWCGARVLILRGVEIGEGTVVGAGSSVTRSLPPYVVAAGNPCLPKRLRFSDQELLEHLRLRGKGEKEAAAVVEQRRAAAGDLPAATAHP